MFNRHVTHLLTRYVNGTLRASLKARVVNHVRVCDSCRAALAREER
ncbi:MAG: zf-HC2 domain-containing protein, partial [Anaerolineae bacterium]|nr:zf-HC2 domain-containing protein [Anaerolineae bacterium]